MKRMAKMVALLALVLLAGTLPPVQASGLASPAAIIQVFPGTNAIRKALKQASPGDVLNIHAGTYNEAVRVKKANVTLRAAGDGPVIVDAGCNSITGINLEAEGITIKGLTVRGALNYAINLEHLASGRIIKNTMESTCPGADYGVNIFDGGSIVVTGNTGSGWDDAVIYVGGIVSTPNGALRVKNNTAYNSVRGIIVEDSTGVNIKVLRNNVHDNTDTGIYVNNSDGALFRNNTVTNNTTNGILLTAASDGNAVIDNTFTGHTYDMNNAGTGNCFSGNTYVTSNGDVSNACS